MRVAKVRLYVGIAIIIAGVLFARYISNPERRIFSMVEKNQERYKQAAMQMIEDGEIQEVPHVDSISKPQGEHMMVDFYVTGLGIAPASTYYGFYYSPDDVPLVYGNYDIVLTQCEKNTWEWSANGDNKGVTKKIADCWYYYEASF